MYIFLFIFGSIFLFSGVFSIVATGMYFGLIFAIVGGGIMSGAIFMFIRKIKLKSLKNGKVKNYQEYDAVFHSMESNVKINGIPFYKIEFAYKDAENGENVAYSSELYPTDKALKYRDRRRFKVRKKGKHFVILDNPIDINELNKTDLDTKQNEAVTIPQKPSKVCGFCGGDIDKDSAFCKYCGSKQDF